MSIRDLIPSGKQWKQLQDVESSLLRRKRAANSAGIIAALTAGVQIALVFSNKNVEQIGKIFYSLVRLKFGELASLGIGRYQAIGWIGVFLAAVTYYTLRRTTLLLKESKAPFRYTFWIQPFAIVQDTPLKRCKLNGDDRFHLLHHDLAENITQRIQRFSILEAPSEGGVDGDKPVWLGRQSSHINIYGSVAVREEQKGKWVLHVMPLLRMGPVQFPATLAPSVKYPLNCKAVTPSVKSKKNADKEHYLIELDLSADDYNQMVERVYSRLATEVYAQIERDIRTKIDLFPTAYTRAVALYYEAEDFARSNTIDAYERAIGLYRDALRFFELMPTKWLHNVLLLIPFAWRGEVRYQHQRARVVTGYAKCLVYKERMSTLSGRDSSPLYELPELLTQVIHDVERLHAKIGRIPSVSRLQFLLADVLYPRDSWFNKRFGRSYTPRFEAQKRIQFELYIVEALVEIHFGSWQNANAKLQHAQATATNRVAKDPLYLLARGLAEPVSEKKIPYFRQAVDNEPNFQMAQWFLAEACEKEFRLRDEIKEKRALSVINEYNEVLKINYGNIAALAAQGHLLWLISSPGAKRRFEEGRELKAIARETFVGQLNYGLARIAAEDEDYDECRNRYSEAVGADPTLGAHVTSVGSRAYRSDYDDIGPEMLERFRKYKAKVERSIEKLLSASGNGGTFKEHSKFTEKTLRVVHGFVLNDYANACLRYFLQHGSHEHLEIAISTYEKAAQINPSDPLPWFNLQNAYGWQGEYVKAADCFPRARELAPSWSRVAIDAAREGVANAMGEIEREERLSAETGQRMQNLDQELYEVETELKQVDDPASLHQGTAPLIYEVSGELVEASKDTLAPTLSEDVLKAVGSMSAGESFTKELLFQQLEKTIKRSLSADERHLLLTNVFRRPLNPDTPAALQGQAGADPKDELLKRKDRLLREQKIARGEVAASTRKLVELRTQFRERMTSALKELSANSRLAALFEGTLEEQIGRVVAVPWRKLDAGDVGTLIALAEVLSNGGMDQPEYLLATQHLAEHLLEMYPEDARVAKLLQIVVPKLIAVVKKEIENSEKALVTSRVPQLMRDAVARLIERLEKTNEPTPEEVSLNLRTTAVRRKIITKLIVTLERTIEPNEPKNYLNPRTGKRRLNCLNQLLKDSNSRWKTIVDYWIQTDSRTFISLYWYVLSDPKLDLESLNNVRDAYFKRETDVFQNLLGHVYFRLDRVEQAIEAYNRAVGLKETKAVYHFNLGKALYALGRVDEARSAFYRAHSLDTRQKEYSESLASSYNAVGYDHYQAGEFSDAIDNYLQAISLSSNVPYFHSNLSYAWEYTRNIPEPIALQKAIDAIEKAHELDPDETEFKDHLERLRKRQTMIELYGQTEMAKRVTDVIRIAITFGKGLCDLILREDQAALAPSVNNGITKMREKLKETFGVELPLTHWRLDEHDLTVDSYKINLDEIPLVLSTIHHDKKLCLNMDELLQLGIAGESASLDHGEKAVWLQKADWDRATAAGLQLLDPLDVILLHLRDVLRRNLASFIGLSEAYDLLQKSEEPEIAVFAKSHDAVNTLTMVLKGLLAEEVPIAAIEVILSYFQSAYGKKSTEEMIEELRKLTRLSDGLPGNSKDFVLLAVGQRLETVLKNSLVAIDFVLMPNSKNPEKPMNVLAMVAESRREALLAIRAGISSTSHTALVVSDQTLRNPLRKLVAQEFPKLHVFSKDELPKGVNVDRNRIVDLR